MRYIDKKSTQETDLQTEYLLDFYFIIANISNTLINTFFRIL